MQGDDGGCEAFVVVHKSPGVGDEEGGCKASGLAENSRGGGSHGVGGGVESPQGANTPRVVDKTRRDETPEGPTATEVGPGEHGRGRGGGGGRGTTHPPT